jgi:hypothetical protein
MTIADDLIARYATDTPTWWLLRHQAAQLRHRLSQADGAFDHTAVDQLLTLASALSDGDVWRETHATVGAHFAAAGQHRRALEHMELLFGKRFPPEPAQVIAAASRPYSRIGLWRAAIEVARHVNSERIAVGLAKDQYLPEAKRFGNLYHLRVAQASFGIQVSELADAIVIPIFQY